jgi:hypothetical protein
MPIEALVVGGKPNEVRDVEDVPAYVNRAWEIEVSFEVGRDG